MTTLNNDIETRDVNLQVNNIYSKPTSAELPMHMETPAQLDASDELYETYKFRLPWAYVKDDYVWPGTLTSPEWLEIMKDFQFRKTDIIIASYPKSGTTWVSELVSLMVFKGDVEKVKTRQLHERVPWLELDPGTLWIHCFLKVCNLLGIRESRVVTEPASVSNDSLRSFNNYHDHRSSSQVKGSDDAQSADENQDHPRVFFTHLPLDMMPRGIFKKGCKIIYVSRNPKDVAVSFYHFHQIARFLGQQEMVWAEYLALFASGKIYNGSWFDHVLGFWNFSKSSSNILFVQYENLKNNLPDGVNCISSFLDIDLSSEAIDAIVEHCSFKSMKDNKMTNRSGVWLFNQKVSHFMRKGIVGDWKNYFTVAQNQEFDDMCNSLLVPSNLKFKFEL